MKTHPFPRRSSRVLACICVLAAFASAAIADDTADAMKALQTAIEKEAAQKKPDEERMDRYGRGDMSAMFLAQLRTALSRGESTQLDELLNQIPVYLKSDAVREAADKLRTAVNSERVAKDQAFAAQIEAAISSAAKAVQEAKKPADLDETLSNLARAQEQSEGRYSDRQRSRMDKARNARQFVTRWQDYLSNRDAGNLPQAIQQLQNVSNEGSAELIPRSEILARIQELSKPKESGTNKVQETNQVQETPAQKISAILAGTKSLDEIPSASEALAKIQKPNDNWNDPALKTKKELDALRQAYLEYQAGLPCQLPVRSSQGNPQDIDAFNAVLPLRIALLRLTLPRYLNTGEALNLGPDETIQKYLDRIMSEAQARADARLIGRVKELQDALSGTQNTGNTIAFLQPLLAAQNQEAAGQYLPAVISYQLALKTGGELVPAKAIGSRLEAIKAAHSEDYEKGLQMFLNNQIPAQPQNFYRNMQPVTSIAIPGTAATKPAASPSPSAAPNQ